MLIGFPLSLMMASSLATNSGQIVGANNLMFAYNYNTMAQWVHNAVTTHTTGANALVNPIIVFVNGLMLQDGAGDAYYDFNLIAGIKIGSTRYPLYQRGTSNVREIVVPKTWGMAVYQLNGVTIPPFTRFKVYNRRVAADNGAAGSYNVITSHSGIRARQDGIVSGTDPNLDYTLGGYGEGGAAIFTSSGGVITGGSITDGGANYTNVPSMSGWYGAAGQGQPGAQYQSGAVSFVVGATKANPVVVTTSRAHGLSNGQTVRFTGVGGMTQLNYTGTNTYTVANVTSTTFELQGIDGTAFGTYTSLGEALPVGVSGTASISGGALTGITASNGGVGHNDAALPLVAIGGTNSWGIADQTTYGPCLIMGEAQGGSAPYFIACVDSIGAGFSSTDGTGDLDGSHGGLEQAISSRLGYSMWKIGRSGDSAQSWVGNHTKFLTFLTAMQDLGLNMLRGIFLPQVGSNDFGNSGTLVASTLETRQNAIITEFVNRGIGDKAGVTIPPRTTSTNGWTDTAGQAGTNACFQAGGEVLNYNTRLRNNTGNLNVTKHIDMAVLLADATEPFKWKQNLYASSGIPASKDGIHPSKGVGIPYIRENLVLPTF